MITIYGIKNCDTIKKTLRWFKEQSLEHTFHDYRQQGVPSELFNQWIASLDNWEALINKRGTTWRQLDADLKTQLSKANVIPLMCEYPALIKRPIISQDNHLICIGYDEDTFQTLT